MSIKIKIAKSPLEIDQVSQLRYEVFSAEDKKFPKNPEQRLYDRYDYLPTTINVIAKDGDQIIGTVRYTRYSEAGIPAMDYFDYLPYIDALDERVISCSLMCIKQSYRGNPRILLGMLLMGFYWSTLSESNYCLAPINPMIQTHLERMGFRAVSEIVPALKNKLPIAPMLLDNEHVIDMFLAYVKKQKMTDFIENFEREIFYKGDTIIKKGDKGSSAYVLVNGVAKVLFENGSNTPIELGQIFGELALLTDDIRSATIVAETDVDVMVLNRKDFQAQVLNNPEKLIEMLNTMGQRLKHTTNLLSFKE